MTESMINFERGNDPKKTMEIGNLPELKDKLQYKDIQGLSERNKIFSALQNMHVINISSYEIKNVHFETFDEIIHNLSLKFKCNGNQFIEPETQETIVTILPKTLLYRLNHIPVFLIDEENMPHNDNEENSPEFFGYYTRVYEKPVIRSIFICPQRISDYSSNARIDFKHLFAKILIHEFAHVLMDPYDEEISKNSSDNDAEVKRCFEEPLANLFTLLTVEGEKKEIFKEFIHNQPTEYRWALDLYEKTDSWKDYTVNYLSPWLKYKKANKAIKSYDLNKLYNLEGEKFIVEFEGILEPFKK